MRVFGFTGQYQLQASQNQHNIIRCVITDC